MTPKPQKQLTKYILPSPTATLEDREKQAIEQCEHLIHDFAKRADRHKKRYRRLQNTSITLAVGTTILSALSASKVLGSFSWIVPTISGVAALSTTLLSQTNSQKMWTQSRNISQQFQAQLFLYCQCSGGYANAKDESERLQLFSNRIIDVWSQAQEEWSQHASAQK
ncbi:MAG: DUF4231 domain-containing protein [Geitlerinemataceae cyanobacterium]